MMLRNNYLRLFGRQPVVTFLIAACVLLVIFKYDWIYSPREFVGDDRVIPQYRPGGPHGGPHGHQDPPPLPDTKSPYLEADAAPSNGSLAPPASPPPSHPIHRCDGFPNLDDIVIVIKTGATEAFEKVPIQFLTFLQCVEDRALIFSDMEQDIGPYHVHDALDQVTDEAKNDNPDFDLYRLQQEYLKDGIEVDKTLHGAKSDDAWNLDKYKNIHVAKKAYEMRPDASWYLFIDADTYVVWSSLLRWLERLDSKKSLYMGSLALMNDIGFAHGGSGYVLSAKAMQKFIGDDPGVANRFDERAKHECCGDVNLALAIYDKDVAKLHQVWPMINGEKPRTFPFGPSHWCQPIITMHHVTSAEINDLWWYEQRRSNPSKPILIHELYDEFVKPQLRHWRGDWDNTANDAEYYEPSEHDDENEKEKQKNWNDVESSSWKSYDDCKKACTENNGCFMFLYRKNQKKCALSWSFRLGGRQALDTEEKDQSESGWLVDRIEKWITDKGNCTKPEWVKGS